ncbi:hypothetical protein PR048_000577 [Dryococelus australis]|uniref:Uncharacterized protein n=1 Tax=Dryococelus australis TaxID=614101 RepID=A0ABQ9IFM0_9NEOP|nr:hypothetical protein PR048_000577 [Dryococelus australis]
MYKLYVQFCSENGVDRRSVAKNDTWDACDSYRTQLNCEMSEEAKAKLKFDYDTHMQEAQT